MAYMTLEAQIDGYFVSITGQEIMVWKGTEGSTMFHGTLDNLAMHHPEVIAELLKAGIIKPSKGE